MLNKFKNSPVIPVLTLDDVDESLKIAEVLVTSGLSNLEVTLRTPNAFKCIEAIKKEFSGAFIGAGTVVKKEQFQQVKDIGCSFAVSPGFTETLVLEARKVGISYLPGVSTPSEIIRLRELGVTFQKFFHASNSGGHKILQAYANIFTDIKFCPTGGIKQENYQEYLKLNNVLCLGGSWMVSKGCLKDKNFTLHVEEIVKNF